MAVNGVIQGKLINLERVIGQLRSLGTLQASGLEDWILRSAIERNLQVAVEIVVDICHRLLSLSGRTPAASSRDAIEGCVQLGALTDATVYGRMVGFRNLVVHRYEFVENSILLDIVNHHLGDFDRFREEVLAYVSH